MRWAAGREYKVNFLDKKGLTYKLAIGRVFVVMPHTLTLWPDTATCVRLSDARTPAIRARVAACAAVARCMAGESHRARYPQSVTQR